MGIQGLYKPKKSWGGCLHLLLVYDASKLSTVYVVKSPVLGLQRAFENSVFPPSVQSSLIRYRTLLTVSQLLRPELLKMASQETIPSFYECSPLLGVFCVQKTTIPRTVFFSNKSKTFKMSEQLLKFGYILYCLNGEYIS